MTCDRCIDIHKAQKEGKTQRECGCSCHDSIGWTSTGTTTGTINLTTDNSAGNTLNFSSDTGGAISGDQVF